MFSKKLSEGGFFIIQTYYTSKVIDGRWKNFANNTFFEDKQGEVQEEPEKIKVGDQELTKEELEDLVGIGYKAKEWSEKAGVEFDELKTKFGKRGERIGEYKRVLEEKEKELERFKSPPPQEELDKEALR